ncbi:MAG TPA: SulP family inorganic anion transporter [Acidimicrobiales bacterium]|nr:SulP family inorganic anion transporter [Acidimicrobiales bacterium]
MARIPLLTGVLPIEPAKIPVDVIAGVTLAALAIPEVMGYTSIAGMPVVTGLYTILLPIFAFALLGSSRHLVVGADSATAAVMAAGIGGLAVAGSSQYVALAGLLALMAAALLIIARLIGLGFLADFLSRTVLIGFLTGVGIQVACGQIGGMLGIPEGKGVKINGHEVSGTIGKLVSTLKGLDQVSWTTVAVSAGVLGIILGLRFVNKRIPGALIAVVGSIFISWAADLSSHGVATLGKLPGGLPSIGLPSNLTWSDVSALLGTAVSIFVLILAQSAATSRAYAAKYNDRFDENVDLVGLAGASAMAGLSGTFVVNGSPTKTQMVDGAGGRSQVAQVTTGLIVMVVLLFLTAPIQYMPKAVLASVVFLIGVELVDVAGMRRVARLRVDEFVVAALVAATVVVVGVEQGIVLAIVASLIDHLRRSYRPPTAVLQPVPSGPGYHGVAAEPDARSVPGLVVYRFAGSLYYANAELFNQQVTGFATATSPPAWVCIDMAAMPDIDYTGGETCRQVYQSLTEHGVHLVVAEPIAQVRTMLDRYGFTDVIGPASIYETVAEAIEAFHASGATAPSPVAASPDGSSGSGGE